MFAFWNGVGSLSSNIYKILVESRKKCEKEKQENFSFEKWNFTENIFTTKYDLTSVGR